VIHSELHFSTADALRATDKILEKQTFLWILGDKKPNIATPAWKQAITPTLAAVPKK
jgi:hypothetical protein